MSDEEQIEYLQRGVDFNENYRDEGGQFKYSLNPNGKLLNESRMYKGLYAGNSDQHSLKEKPLRYNECLLAPIEDADGGGAVGIVLVDQKEDTWQAARTLNEEFHAQTSRYLPYVRYEPAEGKIHHILPRAENFGSAK